MLFPTMTFAVFFLVVMPIAWKLRPYPTLWKVFLLVASYVFYAAWDWRFVGLLVVSTVGNQVSAQAMAHSSDPRTRRWALIGGLVLNLGLLGFFKYYGFFVETLVSLLRPLGLAPTSLLIEITLPVAISFFTFCGISYIIDVHRGQLRPAPLLDLAVYLAFFPHLVAGPIVRGSEILPQLRRLPDAKVVDATRAARLISRGLIKKVIVADFLARAITDPVFNAPRGYKAWDLLIGAYGFSVQIYADFSGYTDIAIGCALLLGIKFPQNFDRPYVAATLQEFWRRWHMTLSRFLRDYLYIPLGGNRHGMLRSSFALMATMLLGGLWHGASWSFAVWGGLHGCFLVVNRLWGTTALCSRLAALTGAGALAWTAARIVATFHAVCLAWCFFRLTDIGDSLTCVRKWFDFDWDKAFAGGTGDPALWLLLGTYAGATLCATAAVRRVDLQAVALQFGARPFLRGAAWGVAASLFLVSFLLAPGGEKPPFIYFQF